MLGKDIRDHCHINTNTKEDSFVGVICEKGNIDVFFPLGFHLSDDEKGIRKDIKLLINTISSTVGRKDSRLVREANAYVEKGFPIQAYLYIISDYLERGYYTENAPVFKVSERGKINWPRTIKTQKPFLQGTNAYYLKFLTLKNPISENELITLIHKYCVYDSFRKAGWLFSSYVPPKPAIKFNKKLFRDVVAGKLASTYNDRNKKLFQSMIAIIEELQDSDQAHDYKYGTYHFEYVWEAMIDKVYGVDCKEKYFPRTFWKISDTVYYNRCLEPDSIMLWDKDVFVLDAKYYKYGATRKVKDLPESTSINKQITYGEFIAQGKEFNSILDSTSSVYNAFLMPFDSLLWSSNSYLCKIGEAFSSWKTNNCSYDRIHGILIDVKHLMSIQTKNDTAEIQKLATCILDGIQTKL